MRTRIPTHRRLSEPHYWTAFGLLMVFGVASVLIYGWGDEIALQIGVYMALGLGTPMAAILAVAFMRSTRVLAITLATGGTVLAGLRLIDSLPNPVIFPVMVVFGLGVVALAAACIRWETDRSRTECVECGYSREGLDGIEVCPECGHALPRNLYGGGD